MTKEILQIQAEDMIFLSDFSPELQQDLQDCTTGGQDASPAVEYILETYNVQINPANARAHLREYGAWDEEELKDDMCNLARVVWLAACNMIETETDPDTGKEELQGFYFSCSSYPDPTE